MRKLRLMGFPTPPKNSYAYQKALSLVQAIEQRRRHSRAPVHEFALTWWKKHGEEYQVAMRERNRSKVGRMARLRGEVERAEVDESMAVAE
jgi:hypothetical protein